ncbi:hypothetical protein [Vibrio jasicida]|uniref:hypothetical protein n=1 Tax=Vibrio jasicida TaxID=766224 RepID=UPI0005EF9D22|nr:hypothetical protein [Vibrio jasicida]
MRFISEGRTAFKVHVPKPEGGVVHRSVGFVRKGKQQARKEAIALRNQIGREQWQQFWTRVLRDETLLLRLRINPQPKKVTLPHGDYADGKPQYYGEYYCTTWMDDCGVKHFRKLSINRHGAVAAYLRCKRMLYDGIKQHLDILLYMERISRADLRQVNTYLKDIK